MSEKFWATVERQGDADLIKLAGIVDEDNELGALVDRISNLTTIIHLGGVERINSCGIRDWVNWLKRIEATGTRPVLVECSPVIVAQLNLVRNFAGNAVVQSFYLPYHCPWCDEEKLLLTDADDLGAPPYEPPLCLCNECDRPMTFDDMPDAYFSFLLQHRTVLADTSALDSPPARRSSGSVMTRPKSRISQPVLRRSAPVLSAFQESSSPNLRASNSHPHLLRQAPSQPEFARASQQSINTVRAVPPRPPSKSSALVVLVGVMVCVIAVLLFLLLAR